MNDDTHVRRPLLLPGMAAVLLALVSCGSAPPQPGPSTAPRPGDPIRLELVSVGSGRPVNHLVLVNESLYEELMQDEEQRQMLPRDVQWHSDEVMVSLVRDLQTLGYFRYAGSGRPSGAASFLALRLPGQSYFLVNPLQGGRPTPNDEWKNSVIAFQTAYNEGNARRFHMGLQRGFDPWTEQQRLERERNERTRSGR